MKRNILILSALLALPLMASNLQWQAGTVVSYFETLETDGTVVQHYQVRNGCLIYTAYFNDRPYSSAFVNLALNDAVRFAEKGDHWWQLIVIDRDGHKRQLRAFDKKCQW